MPDDQVEESDVHDQGETVDACVQVVVVRSEVFEKMNKPDEDKKRTYHAFHRYFSV